MAKRHRTTMELDDEGPASSGLCTCNLTSIQASNASVAAQWDSRVGAIDRPGLEGGHDTG